MRASADRLTAMLLAASIDMGPIFVKSRHMPIYNNTFEYDMRAILLAKTSLIETALVNHPQPLLFWF